MRHLDVAHDTDGEVSFTFGFLGLPLSMHVLCDLCRYGRIFGGINGSTPSIYHSWRRDFSLSNQYSSQLSAIIMSSAKGERIVDERSLHITSIFQKTGDHALLDHAADSDEEVLTALGYKQEFKRDFSIWSSFSVSFSVLGLLPSIASTLSYNLAYSGPAGSVWGWLVAAILIQFVALAMAELCSSMPTAGGLYYASAVLAPEGWGPLC